MYFKQQSRTIVPLIASSVLWIWLFNPDFGLLNTILMPLGVPRLLVESGPQGRLRTLRPGLTAWTYGTATVIPALILMSLWDDGPMMIIFLAGLQGRPAPTVRGSRDRRRQPLA